LYYSMSDEDIQSVIETIFKLSTYYQEQSFEL
jgi:hypothetical protein